jgi:competence protein ComEC
VTILPLSGGSAVFVDMPGAADDMLVDCGNESPAEFILKPFLRARGVNRLERLVLTHGDIRSVGAAESIVSLFSVPQIVTSPVQFRSPVYRHIRTELERAPESWRQVVRGDRIGVWTVLHPEAEDRFSHSDDAALVLSGVVHGVRVLLLSDLGRSGQEALLARGGDLRADVVVAGLPVDGEPLCEALLDSIRPQVIVITDSEFPANRRANVKLRDRLEGRYIPVICTRKAGGVILELGPDGSELRAMDGTRLQL